MKYSTILKESPDGRKNLKITIELPFYYYIISDLQEQYYRYDERGMIRITKIKSVNKDHYTGYEVLQRKYNEIDQEAALFLDKEYASTDSTLFDMIQEEAARWIWQKTSQEN